MVLLHCHAIYCVFSCSKVHCLESYYKVRNPSAQSSICDIFDIYAPDRTNYHYDAVIITAIFSNAAIERLRTELPP